jgi:polyisoprenoid-binding protein YceI
MKKGILLSALSLTVLLFSFTAIEKESYTIDTGKSAVKWTGYHLAKSYEHNGNVTVKSGSLEVTDGKISGGTFIMDMTSLSNNDLEGKKKTKLENHLKSDDFFAVEKHPEAKLVITGVDGNKASGKITIRGITEEISFEIADMKVTDSMVSASASLKVDRTKHEVSYGWTIENAMLSNEFQLDVNIVANK